MRLTFLMYTKGECAILATTASTAVARPKSAAQTPSKYTCIQSPLAQRPSGSHTFNLSYTFPISPTPTQ